MHVGDRGGTCPPSALRSWELADQHSVVVLRAPSIADSRHSALALAGGIAVGVRVHLGATCDVPVRGTRVSRDVVPLCGHAVGGPDRRGPPPPSTASRAPRTASGRVPAGSSA